MDNRPRKLLASYRTTGFNAGLSKSNSASRSRGDPPPTSSSPAPMRISTRTISAWSSSTACVSCSRMPGTVDLPTDALQPVNASAARPVIRVHLPLMPRRYERKTADVPRIFLDPEGIRPPAPNRLLDLLRIPIAVERLLYQPSHFAVGGKTQRDDLSFAQLADAHACGFRQQLREPQALFETDHAVLHFERVEAHFE